MEATLQQCADLLANIAEALDGGRLTKQSILLGSPNKRYHTLARDLAKRAQAEADAQPDLLAACEEAVLWLDDSCVGKDRARQKCRAAMAQAKGA